MASGFRINGVDTDDLFDPDVKGDGPTGDLAGIGYRKNGVALRYAAASYGTPGAAIGYRLANGTDIGTRWAKKGTAHYPPPKDPPLD